MFCVYTIFTIGIALYGVGIASNIVAATNFLLGMGCTRLAFKFRCLASDSSKQKNVADTCRNMYWVTVAIVIPLASSSIGFGLFSQYPPSKYGSFEDYPFMEYIVWGVFFSFSPATFMVLRFMAATNNSNAMPQLQQDPDTQGNHTTTIGQTPTHMASASLPTISITDGNQKVLGEAPHATRQGG